MKTLTVDLGDRSYPIHAGSDLISRCELYTPHIRGRDVVIVTNETVAPLYLSQVRQALSGFNVTDMVLPDGEQWKTLNTVNSIFDHLLQARHTRTTTLIALGGELLVTWLDLLPLVISGEWISFRYQQHFCRRLMLLLVERLA